MITTQPPVYQAKEELYKIELYLRILRIVLVTKQENRSEGFITLRTWLRRPFGLFATSCNGSRTSDGIWIFPYAHPKYVGRILGSVVINSDILAQTSTEQSIIYDFPKPSNLLTASRTPVFLFSGSSGIELIGVCSFSANSAPF